MVVFLLQGYLTSGRAVRAVPRAAATTRASFLLAPNRTPENPVSVLLERPACLCHLHACVVPTTPRACHVMSLHAGLDTDALAVGWLCCI